MAAPASLDTIGMYWFCGLVIFTSVRQLTLPTSTVSWNVEKPPMVVRAASKDGDTSQLSPTQADHRSVASRISLRALMEASPFETEAVR